MVAPVGRRDEEGQHLCEVEGLELRATFTHVTGSPISLNPFD